MHHGRNSESKQGNPADFMCEYLLCNFFEKFSCNHNLLCLELDCCPLNGVSIKVERLAKPLKAGRNSIFPAVFVLGQSGDLSEN